MCNSPGGVVAVIVGAIVLFTCIGAAIGVDSGKRTGRISMYTEVCDTQCPSALAITNDSDDSKWKCLCVQGQVAREVTVR